MRSMHQIDMGPVVPFRAPKAPPGYKMAARGDRGEIYLYGPIGSDWFGEGIGAKQFADDLKALGAVKTIDLRINSEGGDVFDGKAIYALLVEHSAKVTVHVDGLAASAASYIAMAGDSIEIAEGAFMMVHNARGFCMGGADDMRRTADMMDQVNESIRAQYVQRTGNTDAKVKAWMDAETWFDSTEALKNGFADKVVANKQKVAASVSHPEAFANLPAALRPNRVAAAASLAAIRSLINP